MASAKHSNSRVQYLIQAQMHSRYDDYRHGLLTYREYCEAMDKLRAESTRLAKRED